MSKGWSGLAFIAILLSFGGQEVRAEWSVDVEGGAALNGYNDVRIPGDTGTNISLTEDLKSDATAFIRLRLSKKLGRRHKLSVLVAPLTIKASGKVDKEVNFYGVLFAPQGTLNSTYRFDSYRLTYNYTVLRSNRLRLGLGLTAKIRDAAIKIEGGGKSSEKTNTGFVPLINFELDWSFTSNMGLIFEGDALAAPQGRAEDVLLAIYGNILDKLRLRLGYRILEGGADNDEVYNFTAVHYLSAGMTWML